MSFSLIEDKAMQPSNQAGCLLGVTIAVVVVWSNFRAACCTSKEFSLHRRVQFIAVEVRLVLSLSVPIKLHKSPLSFRIFVINPAIQGNVLRFIPHELSFAVVCRSSGYPVLGKNRMVLVLMVRLLTDSLGHCVTRAPFDGR